MSESRIFLTMAVVNIYFYLCITIKLENNDDGNADAYDSNVQMSRYSEPHNIFKKMKSNGVVRDEDAVIYENH